MSQAKASIPPTPAAAAFIASVERLHPRIAAFDCDGTLWNEDSGEHFMHWEIERGVLPDGAVRRLQARYRDYRNGQVSEEAICGEMVTIHEGLSTAVLEREAQEFFASKIAGTIFPEMQELVSRLREQKCEIWAVSSTNDWVIRAAARHFGIPEDHVLAARVYCEAGLATGRLDFVPSGKDKAVDLSKVLSGPLDVAFGNSIHDAAMLAMASHSFAVNPNPDLREMAQQRGWTVYFPAGSGSQKTARSQKAEGRK